jgi:hypothetical protein
VEKALDRTARRAAAPEPCGQDGRIVAEQPVRGTEVIAQVAKDSVFDASGGSVKHEEFGRVALIERNLCDAIGGEFVVKERDVHEKKERGGTEWVPPLGIKPS